MAVRTVVAVAAGEELTVAYTNLAQPWERWGAPAMLPLVLAGPFLSMCVAPQRVQKPEGAVAERSRHAGHVLQAFMADSPCAKHRSALAHCTSITFQTWSLQRRISTAHLRLCLACRLGLQRGAL